ncbi:MAG: hypothetical protein SCALA702_01290 [Melioribacteraceae bacterium]|nr:MAG: hypothetical protein SCALA702_01290 [Melioribacteraceae bacterium]
MYGYIANGFTENFSGLHTVEGFPGSTPKDIVIKVSGKVRQKYIVHKYAINRCCF